MKKILMLGGSYQQLIAIETAKKLGYHTIVCDYLPNNPGQYIADKFYNVSTTDISRIFEIASKEKVNGILAYASDPAALPAAIVSEKLGLPTNPSQSVEILGIKYRWRQFLHQNGFHCPKVFTFAPTTSRNEIIERTKDFKFPIVIKPTDSSGSKGVCILENWNSLDKAIQSAEEYSRNKILIAEEFIELGYPAIIGGDIFVWNGKIVVFGEMECLRDTQNSPLIPIGKKAPTQLPLELQKTVRQELSRLIKTLNIQFGEMNIEIIIDKYNQIHFLELGPRAGGNMIPIQLSDFLGIDLVKANVQAAMGIKPDFLDHTIHPFSGYYMHYVLHSYHEGTFQGIWVHENIKKNIYRQCIYKNEGDAVEIFDGAGKAVGIIFLHFDTIQEMENFCSNHNSLIGVSLK